MLVSLNQLFMLQKHKNDLAILLIDYRLLVSTGLKDSLLFLITQWPQSSINFSVKQTKTIDYKNIKACLPCFVTFRGFILVV